MAKQNPTGDGADEGVTNADLDLRDQGAVLVHVLTLHPAQLRLSELIHEVTFGSSEFTAQDRYRQAVSDLIATGLLFESGELVLPTRAAQRFNQIVEKWL